MVVRTLSEGLLGLVGQVYSFEHLPEKPVFLGLADWLVVSFLSVVEIFDITRLDPSHLLFNYN